MPKTRLTKTGEPAMGTTIEVHITGDEVLDDSGRLGGWWEPCKVVGKGWSKGIPRRLILVIVEWEDGERGHLYDFDDVLWRCAQEVRLIDGSIAPE